MNLNGFERSTRLLLALCLGFAAWQIFEHAAARGIAGLFALYALWGATSGKCPLRAMLGKTAPHEPLSAERSYLTGFAAIQAVIAYEWLHAGWDKIMSPDFPGHLSKTLAAFAAKNPYGWYKNFLEGPATDASVALGYIIEYGQLLVGAALLATTIILICAKTAGRQGQAMRIAGIACIGGAVMNANFYLASGWMSPSSSGLNMLLFWSQAIFAYVWLGVPLRLPQERSARA